MKILKASLLALRRDRRGTTSIEYAVIGTLVSIIIIAGLTVMGTKINVHFQAIATGMT